MRRREWTTLSAVSDLRDWLKWRVSIGDLDFDNKIFRGIDACDKIISGFHELRTIGWYHKRTRGGLHRGREREKGRTRD